MEKILRCCWLVLVLLLVRVNAAEAACSSYGVDYSNGGAYYIDGSSNQYFSFITVFQGCTQESISPVLVGPDDNEYACSSINTQPAGTQVTSTCGIPYSAMQSGTWRIIVQSSQIAVQRTVTLTVGVPQTVVTTVTPTVVLGITSTPRAQTVQSTITQTVTLIVVGPTVTSACNGGTRTVTNYPQGPTVIITSTVIRTNENGAKTSFWTTTVSTTASCHYPSSVYTSYTSYDNNPITSSATPTFCIGANNCQPTWGGKGRGWGWGGGGRGNRPPSNSATAEKRDVAGAAAVAAVTSTYTETTYTVTRTVVTTIPARTTTELVLRTTTATVTPAATTVCLNGGGQGITVTVNRGNPTTVTQTNLVYQTTQVSGTVWVGQTQYTTFTNSASATACWRAGGWFGV
ncbi:hypothetical protein CONLIGDRAFT_401496 [Coniochaeta ligniaria NRRL 30616]|uniref:Ig-like domain-containing protein n=1 Tax=Coniochaeta ligniaria NRRL 30616 TaxID=1408157 RepID=A0A1J7IMZ4_9PEZI|nr:hypothetical protein CONLIGDRAFT_401496 [Coniochaeta ligniaria NRRL 30616]